MILYDVIYVICHVINGRFLKFYVNYNSLFRKVIYIYIYIYIYNSNNNFLDKIHDVIYVIYVTNHNVKLLKIR